MKKRESIVPETIKKRLESYPGWSDLVRLRKKHHHCLHYNSIVVENALKQVKTAIKLFLLDLTFWK